MIRTPYGIQSERIYRPPQRLLARVCGRLPVLSGDASGKVGAWKGPRTSAPFHEIRNVRPQSLFGNHSRRREGSG